VTENKEWTMVSVWQRTDLSCHISHWKLKSRRRCKNCRGEDIEPLPWTELFKYKHTQKVRG